MSEPANLPEPQEFSLVLGGPLFRLWRRAGLSGDGLELARRRVLVLCAIAWLPMLALSAFAGSALDDGSAVPFLRDIEVQARFLIALPILIGAERHVHDKLRPVVEQLVARGIVTRDDLPGLHKAVDGLARVRNSVRVELALLVLVYTLGLWATQRQTVHDITSWYALVDGERMELTRAGTWCMFVSMPIFQFLLLRWYLRFGMWSWFLLRVSKLNLRLQPTHADRTGGLSFLGSSTSAFVPVLVAQGVLLSGMIAARVLLAGEALIGFKIQVAVAVVVFVGIALGPLLVFAPHMTRAKNRSLLEIGQLASRYAGAFQSKWLEHGKPPVEELLGSGDVQSLADLGTCHDRVREMRAVPFALKDVVPLVVAVALPLLPLLLTILSPREILAHLIKVIL